MLTLLKRKLRKNNPVQIVPAISGAEWGALPPDLYGRRELKLNIGCAGDTKVGFVNLDVDAEGLFRHTSPVPGAEKAAHDVTTGIPADDGSCIFIYSSHFFEHIEYQQLKFVLSECLRVLAPGGMLRIAMPNFSRLLKAYVTRDKDFLALAINERSEADYRMPLDEIKWADVLSLGLYEWGGHKYFYDEEKMLDLVKRMGFIEVQEVSFDPTVDLEFRREHSFYLTAKKS